MSNTFSRLIANKTNISEQKVSKTIELFEEGATIPFIARYRKEVTGSLDEVQIADIQKEWNRLKELEKRKETILKTIEEQGLLTPELKKKIQSTWDTTELEDIYLPYKPKRKTRASMAKAKGLEPLAEFILQQRDQNIKSIVKKYLNNEVANEEEALQGARDIIAEWMSEEKEARDSVRFSFERGAEITSKVVKSKMEEAAKYKDYFKFSEPLKRCPSHRLLAIRRAETEGFLRVSVTPDPEQTLPYLERIFLQGRGDATDQVAEALTDAYKRLLQPSIETEFRNKSKEQADLEAIKVFAENLRQLLLAAPLGEKRILGLDPGFRTGCKVVCLNEQGDLLHNTAIYPHPPQSRTQESERIILNLVNDYKLNAIAVGNGTAGRETLSLCQGIKFPHPVEVFMVNEAGASIYSASAIAREEFPDQDITVRGAVSIGRRLMDPLAELVKIDAKSIGVGQYQHDVNQTLLKESLDRTVESAVNAVGINLNTASKHLLTYVSGLGPTLAKSIVEYRSENGQFTSRVQLKKVPRLGAKAFEQSAGFLRIRGGKNPLDNTAVHPERYKVVEQMAKDLKLKVPDLLKDADARKQIDLKKYVTAEVGLPTLTDILKELEKSGLDPRGEAKSFEFGNVHKIEDLHEGMILPGLVTNITNFGAFVNIGVKQDGLVHISQIANKFVKNPADVLSLDQQVQVKVMEVDVKRGRVNLSMKGV